MPPDVPVMIRASLIAYGAGAVVLGSSRSSRHSTIFLAQSQSKLPTCRARTDKGKLPGDSPGDEGRPLGHGLSQTRQVSLDAV